jgi:hypothetical protein
MRRLLRFCALIVLVSLLAAIAQWTLMPASVAVLVSALTCAVVWSVGGGERA